MALIWLKDSDFLQLIKQDVLNQVTQADHGILETAEATAIKEVQGYLRGKYDLTQIFTPGENRDNLIVMIVTDVLLYHLHSRINPQQIPELRQSRYDEAKRMLGEIRNGAIDLGLPLATDESGQPAKGKLRHSNIQRRNY
mgnify:CR=1 FL=1